MKLLAVTLLIHPLLILGASALAVMTQAGQAAISNPGFHGISQILYEYTSSAANNGSGFEGLGDASPFLEYNNGNCDVYRPLFLNCHTARSCGVTFEKANRSGNNRNISHRFKPVQRDFYRFDPDRRGFNILSGACVGTGRRIFNITIRGLYS